jgi:hypothetical protein
MNFLEIIEKYGQRTRNFIIAPKIMLCIDMKVIQ